MGEHLRKTRMDRGLLQQEVAAEIGVSPGTIKNWEQGHTDPALRHWPALIEFLRFVPFKIGDGLPERIRAWRTIHGVPRDELAARIGVDKSTVWAWEDGKTEPNPEHRERLENLLYSLPSLRKS